MRIIKEDFIYSKYDINKYIQDVKNSYEDLRQALFSLETALENTYPDSSNIIRISNNNFNDVAEELFIDLDLIQQEIEEDD